MSKTDSPTPESIDVVALRLQHGRDMADQIAEIRRLVDKIINLERDLRAERNKSLAMQGYGTMLLVVVDRYRRAIRSLGWTPPDDEGAIVDRIREDLEK